MPEGSPTPDGRVAVKPGRPTDRVVRSAAATRAWVARSAPWLLALAVYAIAAIAVTWPVASDPTATVFGAPGDATGNITLLRYRNELGVGPLSNAVTPEENAPFGTSLPGATSLPQIAVEWPMQIVGKATGEVFAYNLAVLLGITLSAFCCFLLCLHVTGSPWASGIAGVGYGFNPWILERAGGHVHFTHLWSLCLVVLGLLLIREGRGARGWLLFGGATVIGLYTNTYFALFIGVIIAAFVIADLGTALVRRSEGDLRSAALKRGVLAASIYVAALIPQAVVSITERSRIDGLLLGTRSPEDRYNYGARWWEWIVPSDRSPWFSDWSAPFRLSRLHSSNAGETIIYVGLTVLALAIVGTVVALVARRRPDGPGWTAWFAGCIVMAGFVTSLPSRVTVLGRDIPMPSEALSQVVEPWRVYARLFAVVSLGLAILAAIGATWLLARLPRRARPIIAVGLAAVIAFDLAARDTTFSADTPPIYALLARQNDDAPRVEFPLVPPTEGRHLAYIFFTEGAKHPLMNGGRTGTAAASIQGRMQDPSRAWVASALATLGVKWAIVHGDAYSGPPPEKGFRLIGTRTTDRLYRVVARPQPALAAASENFGTVEPADGGQSTQWLQSKRGTLTVFNPGVRARDVTLRFTLASFARERPFTIGFAGRILARGRATGTPTPVDLTLRAAPGTTILRIRTPIAPDSISEVLGLPDTRSVSLQISDIQVAAAPSLPAADG